MTRTVTHQGINFTLTPHLMTLMMGDTKNNLVLSTNMTMHRILLMDVLPRTM